MNIDQIIGFILSFHLSHGPFDLFCYFTNVNSKNSRFSSLQNKSSQKNQLTWNYSNTFFDL